jgi:hypothetical protein
VANQKDIEMLPIVWTNFFNQNKWSSKLFSENKTKGTKTLLVSIGGGKVHPV